MVTANLNIGDLGDGASLTGTFDASANTLAITAGSNAGRITKGMSITISGSPILVTMQLLLF